MPIVDGLTSTKMIRSFEKTHLALSDRAPLNGRVPIFAVSASLVERERHTYINAGFDGWILKPVDFKRLSTLMEGIVDEKTRNSSLYQPGKWERGGWFDRRQPSVLQSSTKPSGAAPVQTPAKAGSEPRQTDGDSQHSSESGSITPTKTTRRPLIYDERLNAVQEDKFEGAESSPKADPPPTENIPKTEESKSYFPEN